MGQANTTQSHDDDDMQYMPPFLPHYRQYGEHTPPESSQAALPRLVRGPFLVLSDLERPDPLAPPPTPSTPPHLQYPDWSPRSPWSPGSANSSGGASNVSPPRMVQSQSPFDPFTAPTTFPPTVHGDKEIPNGPPLVHLLYREPQSSPTASSSNPSPPRMVRTYYRTQPFVVPTLIRSTVIINDMVPSRSSYRDVLMSDPPLPSYRDVLIRDVSSSQPENRSTTPENSPPCSPWLHSSRAPLLRVSSIPSAPTLTASQSESSAWSSTPMTYLPASIVPTRSRASRRRARAQQDSSIPEGGEAQRLEEAWTLRLKTLLAKDDE